MKKSVTLFPKALFVAAIIGKIFISLNFKVSVSKALECIYLAPRVYLLFALRTECKNIFVKVMHFMISTDLTV